MYTRKTRSASIVIILCLSLSVLSGCLGRGRLSHPMGSLYISPQIGSAYIKRVVVLPFANHTRYMDAGELVSEAFIKELEKAGKYEIISGKKVAEFVEYASININEGVINKSDLERIAVAFHSQGVIIPKVSQYFPYQSPVLGINAKLIYVPWGRVVWAVDEVFDSGVKDVAESAMDYYKNVLRQTNPLYKREIMLISMKMFTQYVCFEIVNTIPGRSYVPAG